MALDYRADKYSGDFVYLPKIGEEAEFEIVTISEASNPKFNFKKKIKKVAMVDGVEEEIEKEVDLGYFIQATLKSGKTLSITNESAFKSVFKKFEINDGDHIKVSHPAKGEWVVIKL